MQILNGFIGIASMIGILYLLSENRKAVNWRTVIMALCLQLGFALLVIKVSQVRQLFERVSSFFVTLLSFTKAGSEFLFGSLVSRVDTFGFIFVFQVLPTIVFFAALTAMLYYFGILQRIVFVFAWVMNRLMRLSGAESLAASANVFLGQTEAPLLIKPYLDKMTRSEIMALMTGGMATIAGSVLAAYIGFLGGDDPVQQQLFATHLLSASIMAAPGSLLAAKLLVPECENFEKELKINKENIGDNVLEAISNGTSDGLKLAVNVGAMLLVFTAIMAMLNYIFKAWIGQPTGLNDLIVNHTQGKFDGLSLQYILGNLFAPVAWLIGVRGDDVVLIGQLLGEKTILNEFIAYTSLAEFKLNNALSNPRSVIIATYALCGFANFASIGIQIGGIGALAPGRRTLLSQLGVKALIGGTVACLLNGAIAGMLVQ
ncbi:MAG: NupC/NupG family nucleoside CNT transporter [Bacteroidia bacterium]